MNQWVSDPKPIGVEYNGRKADHPVSLVFLGRWSPRAFTGEPIPGTLCRRCSRRRAGRPQRSTRSPGDLSMPGATRRLSNSFVDFLVPFNQAWAQEASALVVILSKAAFVPPGKSEPTTSASASFDAGAAWASLAFQSYKLGWAAHGMAGFDARRRVGSSRRLRTTGSKPSRRSASAATPRRCRRIWPKGKSRTRAVR